MARSSRVRREAVKAVKKTHKGTLLLGLLFLIVGLAGGAVAAWGITRNDRFVLIGEKQLVLIVGEQEYTEQGAEAVSFGRDISDKIQISGDVPDVNTEGVYQVVYTVEDLRWGDYRLVRTVTVVAAGTAGGETAENAESGEGGTL